MVERFNRTLAEELAKYCSSDQKDCDLWLPFTLMAYRFAQQEATGYTPARIMFGREMWLPLDLATGRPPGEELPQTAPEFVAALQQRMEATWRQVSSNLRHKGQAMTRWYQMRARDAQYGVGDRVWLYNLRKKRGLAPKLQSYWEGPYTILQRLTTVTYKLGDVTSRPPRIVHVAPLWTAVEEEHFTWDQQGPLSSPDSEVGSNSEMEGDGGIDNVAECVVGARKDPENESENEACVSRPLRKRKKPQCWTDYVCESDDE
ncbi:uncharacterized protein LOC123519856 [Portunus trituberculatus]|uniref:uncharacterized protein LOC123519856 n=1 Tax=Portunus trituberculatus TaxID=210409 RepID=UPI001E1CB6AB|nr:uncharacterized protein LOC123519856 [Portunus trituberculatus]XP_045137380.1 uncharacterized protein LOC123519856 [Portunus trituberculatus]